MRAETIDTAAMNETIIFLLTAPCADNESLLLFPG
jgi:hypothetical protein